MSVIGFFCANDGEWQFWIDGDLSPCFAALGSSLTCLLWVSIVGWMYNRTLSRLSRRSSSLRPREQALLAVSSLVGFLPLLLLLLQVITNIPSPYEVFFALIHAFNWGLATWLFWKRCSSDLTEYVRLHSDSPSRLFRPSLTPLSQWPLLTFWLASLLFASVQLRSLIRHNPSTDLQFNVFCGFFPLYLLPFPMGIYCFRKDRHAVHANDDEPVTGYVQQASEPKGMSSVSLSIEGNSSRSSSQQQAGCLSFLTFAWMSPLIAKGFKAPLQLGDVDELAASDRSAHVLQRFQAALRQTQAAYRGLGLMRPVIRAVWKLEARTLIIAISLRFGVLTADFVGPLLLNLLVGWLEDPSLAWFAPENFGYFVVCLSFLACLSRSLMLNWSVQHMLRVGLRLRSTGVALIYSEAVSLTSHSLNELSQGKIQNMMSSDMYRIENLFVMGGNVLLCPLQIGMTLLLMFIYLGWQGASGGVAVMLFLLPIQAKAGKRMATLKRAALAYTDKRVGLISELFQAIRVIKFQAWETSFLQVTEQARDQELKQYWKAMSLHAFNMMCVLVTPVLVTMCSFGLYAFTQDEPLSPSSAFTILVLVDQLRMAMLMIPQGLMSFVEAKVALNRLVDMLESSDLITEPSYQEVEGIPSRTVQIIDKDFVRSPDQEVPTMSIDRFQLSAGSLTVVVGAVGSGKTFLISSLLGETYQRPKGSPLRAVCAPAFARDSVAYVAQSAWIFNGTVRDNILFGAKFDQDLYHDTLRVCCLNPDLDVLPLGDQTEIGERGINLSGGQKQRVSLARAVYRRNEAEIFYFDDPLSALDAEVRRTVYEECIIGILKNKTRVLVTHHCDYAKDADKVVYMESTAAASRGSRAETAQTTAESGGAIQLLLKEVGTFNELMATSGSFSRFFSASLMEEQKLNEEQAKAATSQADAGPKSSSTKAKLVEVEARATGAVQTRVLLSYLRSCGGLTTLSALFWLLMTQVCIRMSDLWLATWTDDVARVNSTMYYISIYFAISGGTVVSTLAFQLLGAWLGNRGARRIHRRMLARLVRAPMSFFDTTPLGRILNRFTRDMDIVDLMLPQILLSFSNLILQLLAIIVMVCVVTEYFALVILPLTCLFFWLQRYYRRTSRELKRLDSITRSPLLAHIAETLDGLATIRAYRATERMKLQNQANLDNNFKYYFMNNASNRWLGMRLDFIGGLILLSTGMFMMFIRDTVSPGLVGLAVGYAIILASRLNFTIRQSIETEVNLNAVERTDEYSVVAIEGDPDVEGEPTVEQVFGESRAPIKNCALPPPPEWPSQGKIVFDNVRLRYRPTTPWVLRDLSLTIEPGERVGVVGRTGAGKSSLMLLLFRMVDCEQGSVTIDGVDITRVRFQCLRSKLSIIPQDPLLFSGTVRYNLDPFDQFTDEEVWRSLKRVQLEHYIRQLPLQLDAQVSPGGSNFSLGQRQLFCFARAILRKSKILVLDEATASVDAETDALIQQMIRSEFNSCTVLTIAHRLNTIIDYHKIVVMEQGKVVEYGPPAELMKRQGEFSRLLAQHR